MNKARSPVLPVRSPVPAPVGGLGPPIDAPDPLREYRWWTLGGFAALLLIGGVYSVSRHQTSRQLGHQRSRSSRLMEGIKEELFQIEGA